MSYLFHTEHFGATLMSCVYLILSLIFTGMARSLTVYMYTDIFLNRYFPQWFGLQSAHTWSFRSLKWVFLKTQDCLFMQTCKTKCLRNDDVIFSVHACPLLLYVMRICYKQQQWLKLRHQLHPALFVPPQCLRFKVRQKLGFWVRPGRTSRQFQEWDCCR